MPYDFGSPTGIGYHDGGLYGRACNTGRAFVGGVLPSADTFTVEIAVKAGVSGTYVALSQGSAFWIGTFGSGNAFAQYGAGGTAVNLTTSVNIADDNWHRLRLSISPAGGVFLVDGAVAASSSTTPAAAGLVNTDFFVLRALGTSFPWGGTVDECAVWSVSLPSAYTPGPVSNSAANLRAVWHFEDSLADTKSSSTPIAFSGTVPTLNGTQGSAFSQSLASYFSGTETPFTYSDIGGALAAAGFSLNTSTCVISAASPVAGTYTGNSVRGTDTASNTADSNGFSIVIAPPVIYDRVDTTDTFRAQTIMVLVPNANAAVPYSSGTPARVILYAHGVGEDAQALLDDSLKSAVVLALLDAGYILAGSNQNGENWGNQVGVDDLVALERYVRTNYNVENVAVWSQSMGGVSGLLAVAQGKFPCVGWLGTYPVCNLAALHALGTYTSAINTAHGVTGSGINTYGNRTIGQDPALLKGFSWRHTPMRFYASASDTVVPKSTNTDVLAALVAGCTREAVVVACTGNHGDASHFDATSYLAFFDRCFDNPVALGRPAGTRSFTVRLNDIFGAAVTSVSGIQWSWWDQASAVALEYPTDKGAAESSDGSGDVSITFDSSLPSGGTGFLLLTTSDGTADEDPPAFLAAGPVVVT